MNKRKQIIDSLRGMSKLEIIDKLSSFTADDIEAILSDWTLWARPEQLPPDDPHWNIWLLLCGRGNGKTRTGSEWIVSQAEDPRAQLALVGATSGDVRDTITEGPAGILKSAKPHNPATYAPSKRKITFASGAVAHCYSAEEPDRIRGGNFSGAWIDELAAFPDAQEVFDMLMLALRIGRARCVITTTPRPSTLLKRLTQEPTTHVTRGSTYDNIANLSPTFIKTVVARYEGTSRGLQELHAHLLDEAEGALWTRATIDTNRVRVVPQLRRIVVAVDPATTSHARSDLTGIVVCGVGATDGHGYILEDLSGRFSPDAWGKIAVAAYKRWKADKMIAESNQGGDLVSHVIATVDRTVPVKLIHASRGKTSRAEPIAALAEQGRIHHVGSFPLLEDEMCSYTGDGASPDRMDAAVYALTELALAAGPLSTTGYQSASRHLGGRAQAFSELLGPGMNSTRRFSNWKRANGAL